MKQAITEADKATLQGLCELYGSDSIMTAVKAIKARQIGSIDLNPGDKVRHIKDFYGTGEVRKISKSGKKVSVRWDPPNHYVFAYYEPGSLIKV